MPLRERAPEALSGDLAARALEAEHGTLRVDTARRDDVTGELQVVADRGDLSERNAGLPHPERPRVHPEEEDLLRTSSVTLEVGAGDGPGVFERVVDVGGRLAEP